METLRSSTLWVKQPSFKGSPEAAILFYRNDICRYVCENKTRQFDEINQLAPYEKARIKTISFSKNDALHYIDTQSISLDNFIK